MRVPTKQEAVVFKAAFECISRVAAALHSTSNIHEIKISTDRELSNPPIRLINLFIDNGIPKMQTDYCMLNQDKTLHEFTQYIFNNRLQPKDFIFYGLVCTKKGKVQEYTYQHTDDSRYSA
ncbi:MAG: hypothetical protein PF437_11140 [Sulfurimonas sp.]|jgi:hypothetical protein|nr:hypothetical protein [Sulfurimonas sp.]